MSEEQIRESVDSAKSGTNFNIINLIADRSYPKAKVVVHIDEQSAYDAALLKDELEDLETKINGKSATAEQRKKIEDLTERIESLTDEMKKSAYIFHVKGISEGRREELYKDCVKKYPIEYERPNDLAALVGGQSTRVEKESPERNNLFTDFLWLEHIEEIEGPDGSSQSSFSYNDIKTLRSSLPLSALAKISSGIEKIKTQPLSL